MYVYGNYFTHLLSFFPVVIQAVQPFIVGLNTDDARRKRETVSSVKSINVDMEDGFRKNHEAARSKRAVTVDFVVLTAAKNPDKTTKKPRL